MAKHLPVALWIARDAADRTRTIGLLKTSDILVTVGGAIEVKMPDGTLLAAGSLSAIPAATQAAVGGVKAIPTGSFPARTDSSGGTSGGNTIAAVTDFPSAANAVATLQAEITQLRAAMVTAGIIT